MSADLQLKVTNVKVKRFGEPKSNVLGVASILINDLLVIHDIRIVQLKERRILSFPAKRVVRTEDSLTGERKYYTYEDIVHPANSEFRKYLEEIIFSQFDVTGKEGLSEQNY